MKALSQKFRTPPSVPLKDADLRLGNANYIKGLQARGDWTWGSHNDPTPIPNNLARYFLHIPGVFERQMEYSTALIFDEASYRNGRQISGFLDRLTRELAISLIANIRHAWYTLTHHALLAELSRAETNMTQEQFANKWSNLHRFENKSKHYSRVELAVLKFTKAFATDPHQYSDQDYIELRAALLEENERTYLSQEVVHDDVKRARMAEAKALGLGHSNFSIVNNIEKMNHDKVDSQVLELAFICLQFVSLADVFSGLNIPDEDFVSGMLEAIIPEVVISEINRINALGADALEPLVPDKINNSNNTSRISHVDTLEAALQYHPELDRHLMPYAKAVIFNEDEWRNGVQTAGFVSRLLKEIVIQKVNHLTQSHYAIADHAPLLVNEKLKQYGVDKATADNLYNDLEKAQVLTIANDEADLVAKSIPNHTRAAPGIFSEVELCAMTWAETIVTTPHIAYIDEGTLRQALDKQNRREVADGVRLLDLNPDQDYEKAFARLLDHQIAELATLVGHMDGLGRLLTILRLKAGNLI